MLPSGRPLAGGHYPKSKEALIPSSTFWRDRRVFVTGHTGFKGAWLCLWLQLLGANVTGYALQPPTKPSLFSGLRFGRAIRSHEGDVRDLGALGAAMRESEPEVVLHLAAQTIVRTSYEQPDETFSTNVMGTVHVLEAARQAGGVRSLVVVTSDKCYENREWYWSYREKSALGGRDPYSASKACAELVAKSYRESYFDEMPEGERIAMATVRAGNVIGGGDWARDRIVPDTIRHLTGGTPLHLRFPNAIRPWQFVLEPLSGYLLAAERLHAEGEAFAGAWNFAPREEEAQPVGWVVERLHEAWGVPTSWLPDEGPKPHEAIYLKLDASKARAQLGWRPRLALEETLVWVADWYKRVHEGADPRAVTEEQIRRYEALA